MQRYAVEGSVVGWTVTVDAQGLEAAIDAARRIAGRVGVPAGSLRIRAVDAPVGRGDGAAKEEPGPALIVEIW